MGVADKPVLLSRGCVVCGVLCRGGVRGWCAGVVCGDVGTAVVKLYVPQQGGVCGCVWVCGAMLQSSNHHPIIISDTF